MSSESLKVDTDLPLGAEPSFTLQRFIDASVVYNSEIGIRRTALGIANSLDSPESMELVMGGFMSQGENDEAPMPYWKAVREPIKEAGLIQFLVTEIFNNSKLFSVDEFENSIATIESEEHLRVITRLYFEDIFQQFSCLDEYVLIREHVPHVMERVLKNLDVAISDVKLFLDENSGEMYRFSTIPSKVWNQLLGEQGVNHPKMMAIFCGERVKGVLPVVGRGNKIKANKCPYFRSGDARRSKSFVSVLRDQLLAIEEKTS